MSTEKTSATAPVQPIGTRPSGFARHAGRGRRRFLVRERNNQIEVYGSGLDHLCWARDVDTAWMIANSLEYSADQMADERVCGCDVVQHPADVLCGKCLGTR
jgi:hypothetical protein